MCIYIFKDSTSEYKQFPFTTSHILVIYYWFDKNPLKCRGIIVQNFHYYVSWFWYKSK